jgi:hypothetical protein
VNGALLARKTWRTLEPLHGMVYFVPEATSEYARLGITGQSGYFASRAAPMGEVGPDVVVSTFYNFNPDAVAAAIPSSWAAASPTQLLRARLDAADAALRRVLGDAVLASTEMVRAASLARRAAEEVTGRSEGRPLAAAHAALEWPVAPHLVLWHAQSVLREYRGDGHVALLVTHGLSGLEALVTHAATGEVSPQVLRSTRQWSEAAWDAAVEALQGRNWLELGDTLRLTTWGGEQRQEIEDRTDKLASAPYEALGEEECAELRALARPWSRAVAALLF